MSLGFFGDAYSASTGVYTLFICMQVVWVEHTEIVGEEKPLHQVFKDYVASGSAFGATRWVSLLQRQCERLASELARNIADLGGMLYYLSQQAYIMFAIYMFAAG